MVGCAAFKPAEFYLKIDGKDISGENGLRAVSIKKCLTGLTESFKDEIET